MQTDIQNLIHGRETYVEYYGDDFVSKRPLPTLSETAKSQWLVKQHKTKDAIDAIRAMNNSVYNVPEMIFIHDGDFQILEQRAHGQPLTAELFASLTPGQRNEIVISLASFLVDMHKIKPIGELTTHKIADEIKFNRLDNFVNNKMSHWFSQREITQMARIRDEIGTFEYSTRQAWSHSDLNPGNVLYDANASKIYFIDFAECGYQFIYHDIFSPLQIELGLCKKTYEAYKLFHNPDDYKMPGTRNEELRLIMMYRIIGVYLKRFIKASDDLRVTPQNPKSIQNNKNKVDFMRQQMHKIMETQRTLSK